jgi:hypothetical protein
LATLEWRASSLNTADIILVQPRYQRIQDDVAVKCTDKMLVQNAKVLCLFD